MDQTNTMVRVIAEIQNLQDMFSRQFKMHIEIFDTNGNPLTIFSSGSFLCPQKCEHEFNNRYCIKRLIHHIKHNKFSTSIVHFTCPNQLVSSIVPLGFNLKDQSSSTPNFYALIGKTKVITSVDSMLKSINILDEKDDAILKNDYLQTVELISFSFNLVFSLISLSGLTLQKNKPAMDKQLLNKLTKRELEIVKLVSIGLSNQEIAYQLFISEHTVKAHISNILKKLNLNNRTKIALFEFQTL